MLKETDLLKSEPAALNKHQEFRVVIAATFTSEVIYDALHFLLKQVGILSSIKFAPYNQVFQQLINPAGLFFSNKGGVNIILIQIEDWYRYISKTVDATLIRDIVRKNAFEFIALIKEAAKKAMAPFIVCLCPSNPEQVYFNDIISESEKILEEALRQVEQVHYLKYQEVHKSCVVEDYYDEHSNKIAHIPYTEPYFAALALLLVRKIHSLFFPAYKVIVVDCDNTLWKGICGEAGATGIEITENHRYFQNFLVKKSTEGMLICLNSKNNEADVMEVFSVQRNMPLKMEHLVAWRCNWETKSQNLKSIAAELGVGLDSLVFIDDSPLECAEVEINCPEVLTLRFPENGEEIGGFLDRVWAFDSLPLTSEDRKRTDFYRQKIKREKFQKESVNYETFLAGLKLEVEAVKASIDNYLRIAQLSQRTNQFNFTTRHFTELEIENLCKNFGYECYAFNVKDRFGDYGMVGAVIFKENSGDIFIDSFFLSCRALGRGVEHKMLGFVAGIALQRGLNRVVVPLKPSGRNQPAFDFLENVARQYKKVTKTGLLYYIPSQTGAHLPSNSYTSQPEGVYGGANDQDHKNEHNNLTRNVKFLALLAGNFYDVGKLVDQIQSSEPKSILSNSTMVRPTTPIERELVKIWSNVLNLENIGIEDEFFALGGYSILLTKIISKVKESFNVEVPMEVVFSGGFTVSKLAREIIRQKLKNIDAAEIMTKLEIVNSLSKAETMR